MTIEEENNEMEGMRRTQVLPIVIEINPN